MSEQGWLHCDFCPYKVLRYRGDLLPGVDKLRHHVRDNHEAEWLVIRLRVLRQTVTLEDTEAMEELACYDRLERRSHEAPPAP